MTRKSQSINKHRKQIRNIPKALWRIEGGNIGLGAEDCWRLEDDNGNWELELATGTGCWKLESSS